MSSASVYAISNGEGVIKIGRALNPDERLRYIQTSSPQKLKLIYCTLRSPLAGAVEYFCHDLLKDKRVIGEWFRISEDEAISTIGSAHTSVVGALDRVDQMNSRRAAHIGTIRKSNGWSEEEMASKMGCNTDDLVSYESATVDVPQYVVMAALAVGAGLYDPEAMPK